MNVLKPQAGFAELIETQKCGIQGLIRRLIPIVSAFWCVFKSNGLHDPLQVMAHNFRAVFLKSCQIIGIKTCMFHSGFHYGTKKHFSRMQSMAGMFTSMWHLAYSKINHFRSFFFRIFTQTFLRWKKPAGGAALCGKGWRPFFFIASVCLLWCGQGCACLFRCLLGRQGRGFITSHP